MMRTSLRALGLFTARLFGIRFRAGGALPLALVVLSIAALSCSLLPGGLQAVGGESAAPTDIPGSIEEQVENILGQIDPADPESLYLPASSYPHR